MKTQSPNSAWSPVTRTDRRDHRRLIDEAQQLGPALARLAETAQRDPAVFCQSVLRTEDTNEPVRLAPVHEEWHDILTEHDRVVLWSATELAKTTEVSVGRVLWEIGKNPNIRILILSSAAGPARKIVRSLKGYIERSVEFRLVFPGIQPDKSDSSGLWTNEAFIVKRSSIGAKDPTVQACGFGGNVLGGRYDLIVVDDYLTAENTHTEEQREKYYGWLKSTIESRRTTRGRLWFIGNAWHPNDAMHRYAAERRTFSKKFPVRDAAGNLAWPEMWPEERIEAEIENRGPIESRRSMFCDPVADADRRFKEAYINKALANGDGVDLAYSLAAVPPGWRTVTGVDIAAAELKRHRKKRTDLSAIVTIAVREKDGVRSLLDVESGRWPGPELVDRIIDANRRYNSQVIVESNGAQLFIRQFVNEKSAVPTRAFYTGKNKYDPSFGIESLAIEFSAGKWVIPNRGGETKGIMADMHPEVRALIGEMLRYDPKSHTGDRLIACLTPGQLITTARGLVPIENVVIGDQVLTHRGRWRPVSQTMSRPYEGDVFEVKPKGMRTLQVTGEHPVYRALPRMTTRERTNRLVPDRASWDFVPAEDLRAGRKMAGDFVLAPVSPWPGIAPTVDDDYAFLAGLYLAEGWAGDHQLNFAFHRKETYLADFVRDHAMKRWGAKTSIYTRAGHGGMTVSVQSKRAANEFRPFGKKENKALPWGWMALPALTGSQIVRGWFVGDGCLGYRDGTPRLRGVSISRSLIYQMQQFLWRLGLGTSVQPFDQTGTFQGIPCGHKPAQELALSATDSTELLLDARPEELQRWGDRWAPLRTRTNSCSIPQVGGVAVRLSSIRSHPYTGQVFNLHVEEDESYVAEGIAVHNCWLAREGARFATSGAGYQKRKRRT